jgi:hypothetical protein
LVKGDWHLMRPFRILVLVGLVLVCLVGCGDGQDTGAPRALTGEVVDEEGGGADPDPATEAAQDPPAPSTEEAPTATLPPTDEPATEEPVAVPTEGAPASESPPPVNAPLQDIEIFSFDPELWEQSISALSSFRQKAVLDFTADGSEDHSRVTYEGEVTTNPLAMHSQLRVEGYAAAHLPSNKIEAIWIGEKVWVKVGRRPWVQVSVAAIEREFEGQVLAVGDLLPLVQQAQRVMPDETVNGLPCRHYVYNVANLQTDAGMTSARGDIWVAEGDGQVVRLTMDGQGVYYGTYHTSGTLALVYDLFDVNTGIEIKPPK